MNDATMQQQPVVALPPRPRRGRPPGSKNKRQLDLAQRAIHRKDCEITIRVSAENLRKWRVAATNSGLNFTEWATIGLNNEARR